MPNIKSQKKRVITNNKSNEINVAKRTRVRNAIKKFNAAITAGDVEAAEKMYTETVSVINCAASDGIYHKNNAARKVASISKKLDALKKAN